jgi:hypothetical protein
MTNKKSSRRSETTVVEVKRLVKWFRPREQHEDVETAFDLHRLYDQQVHVQRVPDTDVAFLLHCMRKTDEGAGCDREAKAQITGVKGAEALGKGEWRPEGAGPAESRTSSKSEGQEGARA